MARVEESVPVQATLVEVWDHYFDPRGWPAWAEGFQTVLASEDYPEQGGTLRWRSTPAGRGDVEETVTEHEPRRLHRVAFSDPTMTGEMTVRFAIEGEGVRVTQAIDYELAQRGPLGRLAGLFFVKGQVRGLTQRTLLAFKLEAEEAAHFDG